ncbi:actin maturation protease-like isoform X1 [Montipora capricornis]|uniref:actin maturation protease-like isoform X1 n=1 Tax=Montipora capricornis TaxID=246305 RepID=UPI0035F14481
MDSAWEIKKQCREIIQQITAQRSEFFGDEEWLLCIREVSTRLQGKFPRCGLSALSMANDLLFQDRITLTQHDTKQQEEELESLLELAQLRGFSEQGEMYSAENLAKLAKEFYGLECLVTNDGLKDGNFIASEVIVKGSAVLVPYDADKNHEPCLQNGHRAHWALVTGVLVELPANSCDLTVCQQDTVLPTLFHTRPSPIFSMPESWKAQHIYLCAKHGKSRHTAVWTLASVEKSNANLFELDPIKKQNGNFVVPEEGIGVGLRGKIVITNQSVKSILT